MVLFGIRNPPGNGINCMALPAVLPQQHARTIGLSIGTKTNMMTWKRAVLLAVRRYCLRKKSRLFHRKELWQEEMWQIIADSHGGGATPKQTFSRVLQELRDEHILEFLQRGQYLLLDSPVDIASEDLSDKALRLAIGQCKLAIPDIAATDVLSLKRQRRGQEKIREMALEFYEHACAFCDVRDKDMLVAAHISRWADDVPNRANLHNVICMCRVHDPLFEYGYFAMDDRFNILRRPAKSTLISSVLANQTQFRLPRDFIPSSKFLANHRKRTGFSRV